MTISMAISCEQDELPALQAALAAFGSGAKPRLEPVGLSSTGALKPKLEKDIITKELYAKILEMYAKGSSIQDIKAALGLKNGRQISAIVHSRYGLDVIYRNLPSRAEQVPAGAAAPWPKAEQSEEPQDSLRPKDKKIETDTKQLQSDHGHPANLPEPSLKDEKIPFTEQQKAAILRMKASGKGAKEIARALGIPDARRVNGMIMLSKRQKAKPPGVPASGSSPSGGSQGQQNAKDAELRPEAENVAESSPTEENVASRNPDPKPISRAALNGMIWDMHVKGMSPAEISDELCSQGYYYGEGSVTDRLKKIEEGRA